MRLAAVFAAALLSTSAMAQDAATPPAGQSGDMAPATDSTANAAASTGSAIVLVPIEEDETPVPALNLMVDQVEDMDVIGSDGQEVGEVDDVLGDQNGQPAAIAVEVGGFLGVGEKRVILMLPDVSLVMGNLQTEMTKQEIEALPEYGG